MFILSLLCAFKIFPLALIFSDLVLMCLNVIYCVFFLFGIYWGYGSVGFTFQQIWKIVSFWSVCLKIFWMLFPLLSFWDFNHICVKPPDTVLKIPVTLFIFFSIFFHALFMFPLPALHSQKCLQSESQGDKWQFTFSQFWRLQVTIKVWQDWFLLRPLSLVCW